MKNAFEMIPDWECDEMDNEFYLASFCETVPKH